jgi:hypothetical protein
MAKITAIEMARKARIDPGLFRQVLRDENFDWHRNNHHWTVEVGSEEHRDMQRVLNMLPTFQIEALPFCFDCL